MVKKAQEIKAKQEPSIFSQCKKDRTTELRRISLGCSSLDDLTRGGLPQVPGISEIYGEPGSGKTQICLQFAVSCARRGFLCFFINTEKRFPIQRLVEMVNCQPEHLRTKLLNLILIAEERHPEKIEKLLRRDVKFLLKRHNARVGLVIIDSVAGLFREMSNDLILRASAMRQFNSLLIEIQDENNIPVVCTNQVSASIEPAQDPETPSSSCTPDIGYKPCLGPIWRQFLTNRFRVTKHRQRGDFPSTRTLEVDFSPFLPSESSASFTLSPSGLSNPSSPDH